MPAHAQTPLVRNCQTLKVTDALIAYCRNAKISRLGFLSPYRADVSETLRHRLPEAVIQTPSFGYFGEQREAAFVRISQSSIKKAVGEIEAIQDLQALFLSCTNLRTHALLSPLSVELKMPVLSSNSVLAWHMRVLSNLEA